MKFGINWESHYRRIFRISECSIKLRLASSFNNTCFLKLVKAPIINSFSIENRCWFYHRSNIQRVGFYIFAIKRQGLNSLYYLFPRYTNAFLLHPPAPTVWQECLSHSLRSIENRWSLPPMSMSMVTNRQRQNCHPHTRFRQRCRSVLPLVRSGIRWNYVWVVSRSRLTQDALRLAFAFCW